MTEFEDYRGNYGYEDDLAGVQEEIDEMSDPDWFGRYIMTKNQYKALAEGNYIVYDDGNAPFTIELEIFGTGMDSVGKQVEFITREAINDSGVELDLTKELIYVVLEEDNSYTVLQDKTWDRFITMDEVLEYIKPFSKE